jgi:hypothetical protein
MDIVVAAQSHGALAAHSQGPVAMRVPTCWRSPPPVSKIRKDAPPPTISFPVPLHVPDLVATSPDGVAQSEIARAMIVCGTFLQELRHESTR